MGFWRHIPVAGMVVALAALSGCGGIAPENDEVFMEAQREFLDARSDPEIRRHAPNALTNAADTLERARQAEDVETRHRLAFMAHKQVNVARQLSDARQRERELIELMARSREGETAGPGVPGISVQRLPEERRLPQEDSGASPATAPATSYPQTEPGRLSAPAGTQSKREPNRESTGPNDAAQPGAPSTEPRAADRPSGARATPGPSSWPDSASTSDSSSTLDSSSAPDSSSAKVPPPESPPRAPAGEARVAELERRVFGDRQTDGRQAVIDAGDFPSGTADLPPALKKKLGNLVELLKAAPERRVSVSGYADDFQELVKNLRLSDARAGAVKKYLADQGVAPSRIWAMGVGEPGKTRTDDTAINRGVRIVVRSPGAGRDTPENAEAR